MGAPQSGQRGPTGWPHAGQKRADSEMLAPQALQVGIGSTMTERGNGAARGGLDGRRHDAPIDLGLAGLRHEEGNEPMRLGLNLLTLSRRQVGVEPNRHGR